jgi:hypothetical protein
MNFVLDLPSRMPAAAFQPRRETLPFRLKFDKLNLHG